MAVGARLGQMVKGVSWWEHMSSHSNESRPRLAEGTHPALLGAPSCRWTEYRDWLKLGAFDGNGVAVGGGRHDRGLCSG